MREFGRELFWGIVGTAIVVGLYTLALHAMGYGDVAP